MVAAWLLPDPLQVLLFPCLAGEAALVCCWDREQWRTVYWQPPSGAKQNTSRHHPKHPQDCCAQWIPIVSNISLCLIAMEVSASFSHVANYEPGSGKGGEWDKILLQLLRVRTATYLKQFWRAISGTILQVEDIPKVCRGGWLSPTPPQPSCFWFPSPTSPAPFLSPCGGQEICSVTDKSIPFIVSISVFILTEKQPFVARQGFEF